MLKSQSMVWVGAYMRVTKLRWRLLGTCRSSKACVEGQKGKVTWKRYCASIISWVELSRSCSSACIKTKIPYRNRQNSQGSLLQSRSVLNEWNYTDSVFNEMKYNQLSTWSHDQSERGHVQTCLNFPHKWRRNSLFKVIDRGVRVEDLYNLKCI